MQQWQHTFRSTSRPSLTGSAEDFDTGHWDPTSFQHPQLHTGRWTSFTDPGSAVTNKLSLRAGISCQIGKAASSSGKLTSRLWDNSKGHPYKGVQPLCPYGSRIWIPYSHTQHSLKSFSCAAWNASLTSPPGESTARHQIISPGRLYVELASILHDKGFCKQDL